MTYRDGSWEWAADRALRQMGLDDTKRKIDNSYRELYDVNMLSEVARKAMNELNTSGHWAIEDQVKLLARKQHDYGHENIQRFGQQGVLVRLWDKISRYENLTKRDETANEPIVDTLMDMIGYCAIYVMILNNWFGFPLEGDMNEDH